MQNFLLVSFQLYWEIHWSFFKLSEFFFYTKVTFKTIVYIKIHLSFHLAAAKITYGEKLFLRLIEAC